MDKHERVENTTLGTAMQHILHIKVPHSPQIQHNYNDIHSKDDKY